MSQPIIWKGTQAFYIAGTEHEDNTLRIEAQKYKEETLTLILPTLCITYADMRFANDIGGVQKNYPDSQIYGPKYFDPPVVINGPKNIEKFTWIRNAKRVTIGPKETTVEWPCWLPLVIPKLRINARKTIKALLQVPEISIALAEPFYARIRQYADGRHVGGVYVTKRHPDWKPSTVPEEYKLWVRAIDGQSRCAIPKTKVNLYTWVSENRESGRFAYEAHWYTNEMGIVEVPSLPCSDKKLIIIERAPWLPRTWRFRPLPGQEVKQTFKLWKGKPIKIRYQSKLGKMTETLGFEALYHVESRDTLERLAKYFCYRNIDELAAANKLAKPYKIYQDQQLHLSGWQFIQTKAAELFKKLDKQFGLPRGWSRPAQRTLHDDPTTAYEHEVLALPTQRFAHEHKLKKLA